MAAGQKPGGNGAVLDYETATPAVFRVGSLTYTRKGLVVLFVWLLWGDLCFQLMEQVATQQLVPLKFHALGAPNWVMGMVMGSIASALNSILNPIISFRSDRFRSRWGRRIPFIFLTLPFLVAALIGVAFGDKIGFSFYNWIHGSSQSWLHDRLSGFVGTMTPNGLAILSLSVFMTLFAFFNVFVNSVFWYLFNDVVPEPLMGRFISLFRVVLFIQGMLYSLCILPHAESHFTEIMAGSALLYFFGFGAMCLFVKEGQYPPPATFMDGQSGAVAAIKTYARECSGLAHYWYLFLAGGAVVITWTSGMFGILQNQAIGLDMEMIGKLGVIGNIAGLISIPVSGWLADRFHPIRVVLWAVLLQVVVATPLAAIWLFWLPSPSVVFWLAAAQTVVIGAPIGALMAMYDPPLLMRIFPRDRYGQFCSANAMCRSVVGIVFGTATGAYFDLIAKHWGESVSYRTLPLYNGVAFAAMLVCLFLLYRSWKKYGGDEGYVPPLPDGASAPVAELVAAAVDH